MDLLTLNIPEEPTFQIEGSDKKKVSDETLLPGFELDLSRLT